MTRFLIFAFLAFFSASSFAQCLSGARPWECASTEFGQLGSIARMERIRALSIGPFRWAYGWGVKVSPPNPVPISITTPATSDIWPGTHWPVGIACQMYEPNGMPLSDCSGEPPGTFAVFIIHVRAGQTLATLQKIHLPAAHGASFSTLVSPPGALEGDWVAVEFHPALVKEPECEPQQAPIQGFFDPPGFVQCKSPVVGGVKPEVMRISSMI